MTRTQVHARFAATATRRFGSGLTALVRPDPALGFVVLDVWHCAGAMDDPPGLSGLAHTVEHVVFGSAQGAARRGASSNATTAFERTNFADTGPAAALPQLLARAANRIARAYECITVPALDQHRRVVLEEIRQREDPARFGSGLRRSLRLLFGEGHPFARPALGSPEEIAAIAPADVARFIGQHYHAAGTIVSIVGSVDSERALDLVAEYLADLPQRSEARANRSVAPAPGGSRREDVEEGQPGGMLRYTFALPVDQAPLAIAGEVAMSALAGTSWSMIGAEVAAEHGVLGVSSGHTRSGTGSSLGLLKLAVAAGVDLGELEAAVSGRVAALARTGPGPDVLLAAKARRTKEVLASLCGARTSAEQLCQQQAWYGDTRGLNDRVEAIRAVSESDVAAIAAGPLTEAAIVAFHADDPGGASWIV